MCAGSPNLLCARIRAHILVSDPPRCTFGENPVLGMPMLVFVNVSVLTYSHELGRAVISASHRLNQWCNYTMSTVFRDLKEQVGLGKAVAAFRGGCSILFSPYLFPVAREKG